MAVSSRADRGRKIHEPLTVRSRLWIICCTGTICLVGCTGAYNLFVGGGRLVDTTQLEYSVVAEYRSDPVDENAAVYQLVNIQGNLAMMEIADSTSRQMLMETHWVDAKGDHFAAWVKGESVHSLALELVIPQDGCAHALRYVYPHKQYDIIELSGVIRPVPKQYGQIEPTELTLVSRQQETE